MAWNPYTDVQNRAFSGIVTTLFPEQTKTLPRILVWSVIFLLDLILGVGCAFHYGWLAADSFSKWRAAILIVAIVAVFWLQGVIWYSIVKAIQKSKEPG